VNRFVNKVRYDEHLGPEDVHDMTRQTTVGGSMWEDSSFWVFGGTLFPWRADLEMANY